MCLYIKNDTQFFQIIDLRNAIVQWRGNYLYTDLLPRKIISLDLSLFKIKLSIFCPLVDMFNFVFNLILIIECGYKIQEIRDGS